MTGEPTIDYDALALDAMRGLVRTVLARTAKSGLPGEHHFYVSFDTEQPGVTLSRRLKERYPREMTIVLQHRFWDLLVHDDRFEVKLTFDGIPERLVVPFAAIKVFFDPSVQYGLRFEDGDVSDSGDATAPPAGTNSARAIGSRSGAPKRPRTTGKKPKGDRDPLVAVASNSTGSAPPGSSRPVPMQRGQPSLAPVANASSAPEAKGSGSAESSAPSDAAANSDGPQHLRDGEAKPANGGAQILSLDQFRKK